MIPIFPVWGVVREIVFVSEVMAASVATGDVT